MAARQYAPIPVDVRMSQYGYWIVELSISPWQRMSVMVCQVGIAPDQAIADALSTALPALGRKQAK